MGWIWALIIIFGGLIVVMATGMPVAFGFMLINIIGMVVWWGGPSSLVQLVLSVRDSIGNWSFLPIPLFIMMGEVMYISGTAPRMLEALDKWLGKIPGRLSLIAITGGTIFATLSGSSVAGVAMLGSTMMPEMKNRGYSDEMSMGPIMGSGGLAIMIPPSSVAVILAVLAEISVGAVLIGIIVPGLLMALLYTTYVVLRSYLQPSLAPAYDVVSPSFAEKLRATLLYIVPLGTVVFMVIGLIMLGIASPTESAATGCLMTFILAAAYKRLKWPIIKKSIQDSAKITVMVLLLLGGAAAFSQILAFTGAGQAISRAIVGLALPALMVIIGMQIVLWFLGCFISIVPIMMITIPVFMPIVKAMGLDPIWWAVIFMINMEMAGLTPPFGMYLFVMQGVAPPGTTFVQCVKAGMPFLLLQMAVLVAVIAFPPFATWLPGLIR